MKKAHAHLVFLDLNSTVGQMYAQGNDGVDARTKTPAKQCQRISMESPFGLSVERNLKKPGECQSMVIPYSAIALILDLLDPEERPFGFVPPP